MGRGLLAAGGSGWASLPGQSRTSASGEASQANNKMMGRGYSFPVSWQSSGRLDVVEIYRRGKMAGCPCTSPLPGDHGVRRRRA